MVVPSIKAGATLNRHNAGSIEQKFYATLPHKIDNAVEEYLAATEEAYEAEWEFWEEQDGETPLGGPMGVSFVSHTERIPRKTLIDN